jgi:hypothetical protein
MFASRPVAHVEPVDDEVNTSSAPVDLAAAFPDLFSPKRASH